MTNRSTHASLLRTGSIAELYSGVPNFTPYLQVVSIKKVVVPNESVPSDRYRLILSDGVNCAPSMVLTQLNPLIESGQLCNFGIIKVTDYSISSIKGKKVLILRGVCESDIYPNVGEKIGEPQPYFGDGSEVSQVRGQTQSANPTLPQFTVPQTASIMADTPQSLMQRQQTTAPLRSAPQPQPPPPPQQQQQQQSRPPMSTRSFMSTPHQANEGLVQPIAGLSPYQNSWKIKARVTVKSEIKTFTNQKGNGKLFSVNLLDASDEIKATAFGDLVDKFFNLLEVNKVYYISNGSIKIAKRQFSSLNNEYEISFDMGTIIEPCLEPSVNLPTVRYNFTSIGDIPALEANAMVDVIGVVKDVGEVANLVAKTSQRPLTKRDVTILDMSCNAVKLTLWGAQAQNTDFHPNEVIAIKGVRVSDFQGNKSLGSLQSSQITVNPDIPEAHQLHGWYETVGSLQPVTSVSASKTIAASGKDEGTDRKVLSQIKDEGLGLTERADFFSVVASIIYIKTDGNISYPACPTEGCNKKVTDEGGNSFRCEKCQRVFDRCDHRYIMNVNVADATGSSWFNTFNEAAQTILGHSANDMMALKNNSEEEYVAVMQSALFKPFLFRVKAKQEVYNGDLKLRCSVISASPLDYVAESRYLAKEIQKYD